MHCYHIPDSWLNWLNGHYVHFWLYENQQQLGEEQAKQSGIFTLIENKARSYKGYDVLFDRPIVSKTNDSCKLVSQNKGPTHGVEKQEKHLSTVEEYYYLIHLPYLGS